MTMKKSIIRDDSFAIFSQEESGIMFYLGSLWVGIHAGPVTGNKYAINISRMAEDLSEETILSFDFKLTKEEYDTAWLFTMTDLFIFDSIDSLVAKRVARDILTFFLMSIGNKVGLSDMEDRYRREWEDYAKKLIHEKM